MLAFPAQKPPTLEEQSVACGECTACSFALTRNHAVFGAGNPEADILLVGEAPGRKENQSGEAFVGKAGELLNRYLAAAGINRAAVYITNVVKCWPPGDKTPTDKELRDCGDLWLPQQIRAIRPRIVVALGGVAATYFLGGGTKITKVRGGWFTLEEEVRVLPTFHPAFLLRNPATEPGTPRWCVQQDFYAVVEAYRALFTR